MRTQDLSPSALSLTLQEASEGSQTGTGFWAKGPWAGKSTEPRELRWAAQQLDP